MQLNKEEFLKPPREDDENHYRAGHGDGLFLKRSVTAGTVRDAPIATFWGCPVVETVC